MGGPERATIGGVSNRNTPDCWCGPTGVKGDRVNFSGAPFAWLVSSKFSWSRWFIKSISYSCSWRMKLKFGEMTLLRSLRKSKAWFNVNPLWYMRYARQMVAERLIPAWQWTRTQPPLRRTSSVKNKMHKCQHFPCLNMYLHYISFLCTKMTQVVEIPPQGRQGPLYPSG